MICFREDAFTRQLQDDAATALWKAELSDGSVAVMDDGRPGESEHSAWLRLAEYIKQKELRIVRFWLQFRSNNNQGSLPENADGYFFSKMVIGEMIGGGKTYDFYLIGYLLDEKLVVQQWSVPALVLVKTEVRDLSKVDKQLVRNVARTCL